MTPTDASPGSESSLTSAAAKHGFSHSRVSWRAFCLLIVAVFLLRGVMLACVIPPFEMWDEYQHLGYIAYVSQKGETPVFGKANVPTDVLEAVVRFPQSPAAEEQLRQYGGKVGADYWRGGGEATFRPGQPCALYEAQQPPIYYWLAAPVYGALGGVKHAGTVVAVFRLANIGLVGAGLLVFLFWLRRNVREPRAAMLAGMWVVFHPLILLNSARVSNDALAFALGIVGVIWAIELRGPRMSLKSAALGVFAGIAALVKTTDLALLPLALACIAAAPGRFRASGVGPRQSAGAAAALLGGFFAVTGYYFVFNFRQFGVPFPMQEAIMNHRNHVSLSAYLSWVEPVHVRFWIVTGLALLVKYNLWVGGWDGLAAPGAFPIAYAAILGIAGAGALVPLMRKKSAAVFVDSRAVALGILFFLLIVGEMWLHAVSSLLAWGVVTTNPWYAAVGMPWVLAALAAAAWQWRATPLGVAPIAAMPILFVVTEFDGVWWRMIPAYSQRAAGWGALGRLASLQPGFLGSATLLAVSVAALVLIAITLGLCFRAVFDRQGPALVIAPLAQDL
jgi:hypothetical protein